MKRTKITIKPVHYNTKHLCNNIKTNKLDIDTREKL